jgi:Flp pilus assembly pilin Flp
MNALVQWTWIAVSCRLGDARRGATAVEYGLIVALIAAVAIGAITMFSNANNDVYAKMYDIARILH